MTRNMIHEGNAEPASVAVITGPAGSTTYMISYRGRVERGAGSARAGGLPDGVSFTLSTTLVILDRVGGQAVVPLSATLILNGAAEPAWGGATILPLPARQA